jgi:hypothetical protein
MTSKKQLQQGQWNLSTKEKLEGDRQRAQALWDVNGRPLKSPKRKYARVFTGCSY